MLFVCAVVDVGLTDVIVGGYLVQPNPFLPNQCTLTYVAHSDPKGIISTSHANHTLCWSCTGTGYSDLVLSCLH